MGPVALSSLPAAPSSAGVDAQEIAPNALRVLIQLAGRGCEGNPPWLAFDGADPVAVLQGAQSWHFVHAPGVDEPLVGFMRGTGTTTRRLYWVTDGSGRQFVAADSAGARFASDDAGLTGYHRYAGGTQKGSTFGADRFASDNAAQVSFFRNRAYDQNTGRWLQEDPIGVAGGLNLYQFNGNNPVAFTDPFGLCPRPAGSCVRQYAMAGAGLLGTLGAVAGAVTTAGTLSPVLAGTGIAVGGAVGALVGAIVELSGPREGSAGGPGAGKDFTEKVKDQARTESDNTCVFCGTTTTREPGPDQSNIDHAIPKSKGGNRSPENAQNTCRDCNLNKATKTTQEYLRRLEP